MLKNWTVITQPVRFASDGVMMRERYLQSLKHANHKHTERIVSIFGSPNTSNKIALAGEEFRLNQQMYNRRGGRPLSSYAVEYCLTLPKGYRPTHQQWRAMIQDCCIALAKLCQLNKVEFTQYKQQVRAVLHQQLQNSSKGSGDHVHLIIGKVIGNRVLKELQQKKATRLIKQAFNLAVLQHIGIDHRSYIPIEQEKGRRLSTWQYQHEKAKEALKIEKLFKQMQAQFDKWLKAKEEFNDRQKKRQANRLIKTYESIETHALTKRQKEQVNQIKGLML
ncbi:hypothetical protein FJQ87_04475 [Shewanella sp. SNU WT4]|uniref:hypothetical protein n=1 Tax=Shewanella sp. SNU WT4 TaxID=2590015 RepID=UPI0011288C27|nr:hypothetical protein [Shewanella sp. SNU WT4]QDF66033.1 hypothetical protein FJQ87_04475 [Shewanella sp. SNU WT4]